MIKHNLLIIDDDEDFLKILTESLDDSFEVNSANSISLAEDLLKEGIKFDIALVDENIGDEKGSHWIKLQKDKVKSSTVFILYSGMASEESILKGLECGADDFLAKPFSLLALHTKIDKLIEYQDKIHDFEKVIQSKNNVINVSIAQASKYGSCMQLTSKLNLCFTHERIRDEIFSYLHSVHLHGCLAFYPINEKSSFFSSQKGICSPVEIEVMELLKVKPRFYRFGTRTIFNHPLVSLFVLNLDDGTIDTDVYIDALSSVIECIGARIAFISYKNSLVDVQQQIKKALFTTKKMVEISKHHQQEVMNQIVQKVGTSFHVLDLTEEQEDYLTELVHSALKMHSQDDINFLEVTQLLDKAVNSVDSLQKLNRQNDDIFNNYGVDNEDELC
jgi:ActR/RegA family two-component response regulator